MLAKETEFLQPEAFCEHTMQQNATVAGALPWTPLGSFKHSPDHLAGFKGGGALWHREGRKGEKGKEKLKGG